MNSVMHLVYSSSLFDINELNSSFDKAVMRIAYAGENRNGSSISKETFESCLPTMFNCPIVCNYDREDDSLGGHDTEIARTKDGGLRFINVTEPIGVVPESAIPYWETIEEDDGSVHEYLCTPVLLWKRQEAYRKVKNDGIEAQSMEITVKDGKFDKKAGVYVVNDFEFTAFCLLGDGIEPCFESAALEVFSLDNFKSQMADMMAELKETFSLLNAQNNEVEIDECFAKGGNEELEEKLALIKEFGFEADALDFAIEDISLEDLKAKLEALKFDGESGEQGAAGDNSGAGDEGAKDGSSDSGSSGTSDETGTGSEVEPVLNPDDGSDEDPVTPRRAQENTFALDSQIWDALREAVEGCETIMTSWGEEPRYWMHDFDADKAEVYVYDNKDWNIYGFSYTMSGDKAVVDFNSKKRMKIALVEFDEGETAPDSATAFSHFEENYQKKIDELNQFKLDIEEKAANEARAEVLSRFEDLSDIDAFEDLKENAARYSVDVLEEKCYAIRGRLGVPAKFSLENKGTKIVVDTANDEPAPYGGVVEKYNKKNV